MKLLPRILPVSTVFVAFVLMAPLCSAQKNFKSNRERVFHMGFSFGYHMPGGDLADRFGNSSMIGVHANYKLRNNWMFGLEGSFFFSDEVNETGKLADIQSEDGEIFDRSGAISTLLFFERGFTVVSTLSRIFEMPFSPNPNSGIMLQGGVGLLQHKIRIEHQNNDIPQLDDQYTKGYDRLSNGLTLKESIGWYNLSNSRLTNFFFGFEMYQAFTQSRRDYNFDLKRKDTRQRLDLLYGFKLVWFLPVYKRMATDYYID